MDSRYHSGSQGHANGRAFTGGTQSMTTQAEQVFGYDVYGSDEDKIGSVDSVWVDDATGELEFVGVKTGWLGGKNHVIPVANAQIAHGSITVPFAQSQIKDAPSFSGDDL